MKSALQPRYPGNGTGIPRNTADFRERANFKLSVNLIAENLTVPTKIYLRKVMYAMLLIFAFTAKNRTPAWLPGSISCPGPNPQQFHL
jgi:hypothetical protein